MRYDGHTHALTVAARQPFTVDAGMGAWGVADGTRANRAATHAPQPQPAPTLQRPTTLCASVAALCGHGPHACGPGYASTRAPRAPSACATRSRTSPLPPTHRTATDGGVHEPVPVVVVCAPCPGVEPFEAADAARFATRPGRHVGRSRYTSLPVAGHPLHVSIVDAVGKGSSPHPLLLVVRSHHAALVDATTGARVHGATLDWSSRAAGAIARPTDIDVDTRFTPRPVARPRGASCTGVGWSRRSPSTPPSVGSSWPSTLAVHLALCRMHQTTLRGELARGARVRRAATGGHGVEVWRLTHPEATAAPTRVQRVALPTEALAAACG